MRRNFSHIYDMSVCALFAAFLCVISPFSIPLGPIPVTLGLFGVLLAGVVLGPFRGSVSVALYLFLGACGLPIFSGAQGGVGVIAGPTGGFLWGYLLAVLVVGFLFPMSRRFGRCKAFWIALSCFFGVLLSYTCGVFQYIEVTGASFGAALTVCVLPFVLIDLAKCLLVGFLGGRLREILEKMGK